jgi:AraC-like DNA-binding protein
MKMINVFTERPSDNPHIQSVWKARISGEGSHTLPARGSWDFIFVKNHNGLATMMIGPSKMATVSEYSEDEAEYFGIKLTPGFFPTHLNANVMLHAVQQLETRKSGVKIRDARIEIPTFDTAELFVDKLLQQTIFDTDLLVQSQLHQSEDSNISQRTIQRRFARSTGISKSHFQRIDQATLAQTLLLAGSSIADVAYQAGYYDQPHLIRSLKALKGFTPSQIQALRR